MEDMHIHLKKGVNDINIMRKYAEKCIELEMKKVVFLDHGNRESKKHTPVLNTKEVIDKYFENIEIIKREYPNLEIKTGLESDFSYDKEFSKKEIDIINNYNFDVVIGSVHGMGKAEYKDYLKANKDMILNYPFDVIGHLKLRKEYEEYKKEIEEIVKLASERNVRFDLNTSDRSRWNIQQLEFMLGLFEKYKAEYSLGSDAHCIEEIGYGIKEMYIKIDKIKSNAERDIDCTSIAGISGPHAAPDTGPLSNRAISQTSSHQSRATRKAASSRQRTRHSPATAPAPRAADKTNTALSRSMPPPPRRHQTPQAQPARQRRCAPVDTAHTSYDASRHPTRASASRPRAPANLPCPSPSTHSMPANANARGRPARCPAHQSHPAPPAPYDRGAKTAG